MMPCILLITSARLIWVTLKAYRLRLSTLDLDSDQLYVGGGGAVGTYSMSTDSKRTMGAAGSWS